MICQIQVGGGGDAEAAKKRVLEAKKEVLKLANEQDPVLVGAGGGAKDLDAKVIHTTQGDMVIAELQVDCRDAMGANAVNTMADGIVNASAFAAADPYRAATHNKGAMNGIIAVVIATGNDHRAIEAGAHAYASLKGQYTSLSTWEKDANGDLAGSIELPMAVGLIGGAVGNHPQTKVAA